MTISPRSGQGPALLERTIALRDLEEERFLYGHLDRNLHVLRRLHGVDAVSRGGRLRLKGHEEALLDACGTVERALELIRDGTIDDPQAVEKLFRERYEERRAPLPERRDEDAPRVSDPRAADPRSSDSRGAETRRGSAAPSGFRREPRSLERTHGGPAEGPARATVAARGRNQQAYLDAIDRHTITFGIGPAGTGKSYLAVASAVKMLRSASYRKIVLCRPAVEAGESLGFLPGDLSDKINPYLRPLYDALNDLLPRGTLQRYVEEEIIEILPLAYMRGRTLDHAVIILDEAQNATIPQMKMFLTRLGESSKMIVTGDMTQTDLPRSKGSGLAHSVRILQGVRDIAFCTFGRQDVVRHPVVRDVIRAYAVDEGVEDEEGDPIPPGRDDRDPPSHGGDRRHDDGDAPPPAGGFGAGVFDGDPARRDRDRGGRRPARDRDHRPGPRGRNGRH